MKNLWETIKYGTLGTKLYLLLVFVLLTVGTALSAVGMLKFKLTQLVVGGVSLIIGLLLILFVTVVTSERDEDESDADEADIDDDEIGEDRLDEFIIDESEVSRKRRDSGDDYSRQDEIANAVRRVRFDDDDGVDLPEQNDYSKYTRKAMKKFIHRYKVKKDYIPVVIDESKNFATERTPAWCWVKKNVVSFLLFEGNERVVTMPLNKFLQVSYRREVPEKDLEAYQSIKNELAAYEEFEPVMPTFVSSQGRDGRSTYAKNLYVLGKDVAITPKSLRALREKYKFAIRIFDNLGVSGEYSDYFKRSYEARVLWTDGVIGQQEYQNLIGSILQLMVDDDELIRYDFIDEVERLVQYRLITTEYADYYLAQRQKKDAARRRR